ncbi:MAG: xanthine dehydrogenase family protein molybdopterin-binding subunit, partial [Candidatus Wallbacteria bacterium]|nr:xanthine dehydrogenase family protein molybdopterin-binding subunit [Candidatus Wallbacteria bacterium]
NPVAWHHRIVAPSIMSRVMPVAVKDGLDDVSVEGAKEPPYTIANLLVDYVMENTHVPVGFWRSVGNSQNAFAVESFIDELAHEAGKDPVEFRKALMLKSPRHLGVLELVAEKAGWGKPLPAGRARGVAVHGSFESWVAQVAEVSVEPDGQVKVHRVVCAVDCGTVTNPDTVEAQMQSAIVFGLTAALRGAITLKDGRVEQSTFADYELLRMKEMPQIEVHIHPSSAPPGGIGEPATPPIAPAVANAIFAATGKRLRKLPFDPELLKKG